MKYPLLNQLKQKINPTVDPNTANYFHKKFFVQENKMSVNKIIQQVNPETGRPSDTNTLNCKTFSFRREISYKW